MCEPSHVRFASPLVAGAARRSSWPSRPTATCSPTGCRCSSPPKASHCRLYCSQVTRTSLLAAQLSSSLVACACRHAARARRRQRGGEAGGRRARRPCGHQRHGGGSQWRAGVPGEAARDAARAEELRGGAAAALARRVLLRVRREVCECDEPVTCYLLHSEELAYT